MAKSAIMMSSDEIASMEADMGGSDEGEVTIDAGQPEAPVAKSKAEPEIEIVGPEDGDVKTGKPEKTPDAKADAKAQADKAKADEAGQGRIQENLNKALREEREARRRIERERDAERQRFASLEAKLAIINEQIGRAGQPQRQEEDQPPDWQADPIAAGTYWSNRVATLERQLAEGAHRMRAETEEQTRQREYTERVTDAYRSDAQSFAAAQPDFPEAYKFLVGSYEQEYLMLPQFRGNPAAVQNYMRQLEMSIVDAALRNGESPAEAVYNLAVKRGWKPPDGAGMAQQPAPVAQQQQQPNPADQVDRLARAKAASETLSGGGGTAPGKMKLSLETIDRMDVKEIQALMKRLGPDGFESALARMHGLA